MFKIIVIAGGGASWLLYTVLDNMARAAGAW